MEAISEATSNRTLGGLENYFSSYDDLPREIILKHDLLRVGHWFTDAALELASQSLVKSYRLFSDDLMPMRDTEAERASQDSRVVHDPPRHVMGSGLSAFRQRSTQAPLTSSTRWMAKPGSCSTAKRFAKSIPQAAEILYT